MFKRFLKVMRRLFSQRVVTCEPASFETVQAEAWAEEAMLSRDEESLRFRAPRLQVEPPKIELRPPSRFVNQDWHPAEQFAGVPDHEL